MRQLENKWLRIILCGIILILVYKLADNYKEVFAAVKSFIGVFYPLIGGCVIAFFTYRPARKIEEKLLYSKNNFVKRRARGLGILAVYMVFVIFIVFVGTFIFPKLYKNTQELILNLPQYYSDVSRYISENETLSRFVDLDSAREKLFSLLNIENINRWVGVISGVANSFLSVFVSIVISVYLILDRDGIFGFMRVIRAKFFKGDYVRVGVTYARRIVDVFYSYLTGMFVDALVVGTITAVVLSLFDVPYAVLLGLLALIGNLIPFFGPIVAAVTIYIISAITFGPIRALWVIVFQLVLGQLDGNLIQPKILSKSTGVSPLLVLLSVIVFGNLFGIVGMVVGVPICAAVKMILLDYLDDGKIDGNCGGT